jgi:hypothetical protein
MRSLLERSNKRSETEAEDSIISINRLPSGKGVYDTVDEASEEIVGHRNVDW